MALLLAPVTAWAAHPLITDDAGTQGRGRYQIEVNGQYDADRETSNGMTVRETGGQAAISLTCGIAENVDIAAGIPYLWIRETDDGIQVMKENGVSDAVLDVKWRFLEREGLSLAVKPGVSLPTGNEDKGLGAGRTGYHVFLIGSKESGPWAVHANLGYLRNVTKFDVEQRNLWHASVAATYEAAPGLKIAGNIGQEKNADGTAHNDPAFAIAGLIYSPDEDIDLDAGVKRGITASETDWSFLAGTTFRF